MHTYHKYIIDRDFKELFLSFCRDSRQNPSKDISNGLRSALSKCNETQFIIQKNRISVNCARSVFNILKDKDQIRIIDLHENLIRNRGAEEIIALIEIPKDMDDLDKPSPRKSLRILNLGSNDIGNKGIERLCRVLARGKDCEDDVPDEEHSKLRVLILGSDENELYHNKLDHHICVKIALALRENNYLEVLDLNRNSLIGKKSQKGFFALADYLEENPTLTSLRLGNVNLSTTSSIRIVKSLVDHHRMHYIDLHGNNLTMEICPHLNKLLEKPDCQITTLLLNDNHLGSQGIDLLIESLLKNKSVCVLNIASNKFGSSGLAKLAEFVAKSNILTYLNISNNKVDRFLSSSDSIYHENSADQLFSNSEANSGPFDSTKNGDIPVPFLPTLAELSQRKKVKTKSTQRIPSGLGEFAKALQRNQTLHTLDISKNKLRNGGIKKLSAALHHHPSLVNLNLCETACGDRGAIHLIHALAYNTSLRHLNLNNNHLSEDSGKTFLDILHHNKQITSITLTGNQLDHATSLVINSMMKSNKVKRETEKPKRLKKELIRLKYTKFRLEKTNQEYQVIRTKRKDLEKVLNTLTDTIENTILNEKETLKSLKQDIDVEEQTRTDTEQKQQRIVSENEKFIARAKTRIEDFEETIASINEQRKNVDQELKAYTEEYLLLHNNRDLQIEELKNIIEEQVVQTEEATNRKVSYLKECSTLKKRIDKIKQGLTEEQLMEAEHLQQAQERAAQELMQNTRV